MNLAEQLSALADWKRKMFPAYNSPGQATSLGANERAKAMDNSQARKEGRFRRLFLSNNELTELLSRVIDSDRGQAPQYFVGFCWFPDLPADVSVDAVHYDFVRRGFCVMLVSEAFEPVPAGEEVPVFIHERKQRLRETSIGERIEKLSPKPGDLLEIRFPLGTAQERVVKIMEAAEEFLPEGVNAVLVPSDMSLTWREGARHGSGSGGAGGACDADAVSHGNGTMGVGELPAEPPRDGLFPYVPAGAVTQTQAAAAVETGDPVYIAPEKSEARLALEYDLRQALPAVDGGILDRLITDGSDVLLQDVLLRAKAGDCGDVVRYLTRAE